MVPRTPCYIVHFDAPAWVRSAIESLGTSVPPLALTVVDNSGNCPDLGDDVRLIRMERNLGYTGGANAGLSEWLDDPDAGDFCVVGSHDLHVTPDTVRILTETMSADPTIGIAGPTLAHGGSMPAPVPGIRDEPWVSGTMLVVRRGCLARIGLLDERYRSYAEDYDLCFRARDAGWRVVVVGDAVAHGLGTRHQGMAARRLANSVLFERKRRGQAGAFVAMGRIVRSTGRALVRGRLREVAAGVVALGLGVGHLVRYREQPAVGTPSTPG